MEKAATTDRTGSDQLQLVSFELGGEEFAVDILSVQEINRMMPLTRVPQSPSDVEGVINLRGKIIPVVDLRKRFGMPTAAYQVSGEYAMIKAAARNGWLDYDRVVDESLISIKRAGADMILTYFAREVVKRMK